MRIKVNASKTRRPLHYYDERQLQELYTNIHYTMTETSVSGKLTHPKVSLFPWFCISRIHSNTWPFIGFPLVKKS